MGVFTLVVCAFLPTYSVGSGVYGGVAFAQAGMLSAGLATVGIYCTKAGAWYVYVKCTKHIASSGLLARPQYLQLHVVSR